MRKNVLALGATILILGITLIGLASVPVSSRWVTLTFYNYPKSELIVNRNFEVVQDSVVNYSVYLDEGNKITINAAISKPGTNRTVGAKIDFTLNDDTQTYQSYDRTSNISLSWTVPKSGNYSLNFDNSGDSSSKEVIVMVMKSWRETVHPIMLVNTPLIDYSFVWIGVAVCVGGTAVVVLELCKKTSNTASNEKLPAANPNQS